MQNTDAGLLSKCFTAKFPSWIIYRDYRSMASIFYVYTSSEYIQMVSKSDFIFYVAILHFIISSLSFKLENSKKTGK